MPLIDDVQASGRALRTNGFPYFSSLDPAHLNMLHTKRVVIHCDPDYYMKILQSTGLNLSKSEVCIRGVLWILILI